MQRGGRRVADVSVPGSAHFRSRIYRDHVHRVTLVQPRRRSYSVTSDKERNVRITPLHAQQTSSWSDLRATWTTIAERDFVPVEGIISP